MPTITLHHCIPTTVLVFIPPKDITFSLSVGGTTGQGRVDVSAAASPPGPQGSVLSNDAGDFVLTNCASVTLHYRKEEGEPSTIEVNFSYVG